MQHISRHRLYFLVAGFYIVFGLLLIVSFPRGGVELEVYKWHTPFFNIFFSLITLLGDGYFLLFLLPVLLFFTTPKTTVEVGLSVVVTFAFIHILKHYAFPEVDRPLRFFGDLVKSFRIEGIEENHHNSFPSGHSGQSMAIATALIFTFNRIGVHILLFATAVLVGWSRVYLMQHFLIDTLIGAAVALISTLLVVTFLQKRLKGEFWNRKVIARER